MGVTGYAGVILAVVVVAFVCQVTRRVRLLRRGGVHVALRKAASRGRGWRLGVGRYRGDDFEWYRVLSMRSGPDEVIPRSGLRIEDRRESQSSEPHGVPFDGTVLRCQNGTGELELAMDTEALTGFLSWLEASPPGRPAPWAL